MKKLFPLLLLVFCMTACKKKYACACTTDIYYPNGEAYEMTNTQSINRKLTKQQANAVCVHEEENINQTYRNISDSSGTTGANARISTECLVQ